ncbi:MAG: diguanylate cyclase [Pseudomonadota bacterium]
MRKGAHVRSNEATVLVVEDDVLVAKDIERTLERLGYQVIAMVRSGRAALQSIGARRPDLVLCDIGLSGGLDGIELASAIRDRFGTPVVFLSARSDDSTLERVADSGSSGYLMKPFRTPELQASLELALRKQASDAHLQQQALTDELTGLYNRRGFFALAQQQLKVASRSARRVLLVFADINGMKAANDALGHEAGDRLLVDAATALRRSFRDSDIIARLGGDEFAVLLVDPESSTHHFVEQRIDASVRQMNARSDRLPLLSISSGVCEWNPALQQCLDQLLADADAKMYAAKIARRSVPCGS